MKECMSACSKDYMDEGLKCVRDGSRWGRDECAMSARWVAMRARWVRDGLRWVAMGRDGSRDWCDVSRDWCDGGTMCRVTDAMGARCVAWLMRWGCDGGAWLMRWAHDVSRDWCDGARCDNMGNLLINNDSIYGVKYLWLNFSRLICLKNDKSMKECMLKWWHGWRMQWVEWLITNDLSIN